MSWSEHRQDRNCIASQMSNMAEMPRNAEGPRLQVLAAPSGQQQTDSSAARCCEQFQAASISFMDATR
eukprot:15465804-Alexandrium_andersonii.AAC.1